MATDTCAESAAHTELYEEMATTADTTADIKNKSKRDNDEKTLPEEAVIGLDKLATEEIKKVETNNPREGCNGTAEGEKMTELASTDRAIIEENNNSAQDIGKLSKTENEMREKKLLQEGENIEGQDIGIIPNRGIPPYESQGEAEEPSKVLDKDDDGRMTPEETSVQDQGVLKGESEDKTSHSENTNDGTTLQQNQLHEEMATMTDIAEGMSENKRENDEMVPVKPEELLDKLAPEETNMVEIENPRKSMKNNEDDNDGTVEVEKAIALPSVAKAIEKPINTQDEMLPVEPEVVLDKLAPEETNMVEIDNPRESLKNNENGNGSTVEVETVLQVDINRNDNYDSHQSKILENDTMVDGSVPQENPEEELSDMITEYVKQASVEAPRRLHTDDNEIVAVCEGISEVQQQCTAEMSKDDADSKKFTCENEAEKNLKAAEEESIEGSDIQQNIEPITFSKELISNKSDEGLLKEECEEKTSHSENTNDGTTLQEKKRDNDEKTLPEEAEIGLDKLATEENKKDEINNPQEGCDGTAEGETMTELASTEKAIIEENNSSAEDIGKPSKTENEMQEKLFPEGENREDQDMGIILNRGIPPYESQEEAEEPSKVLYKDNDGGMTPEETVVQDDLLEKVNEDDESGDVCNENGSTQNVTSTETRRDEGVLREESQDKTSHSENTNDGTTLQEKQLHEEMGTLTDIAKGMSKNKRENDEMVPVEPDVMLDKQALVETNMVEIDNPHESLKNNEDGNDRTVEVENAPSVAEAIEEPNCSAEPVEKSINTEDEIQSAEHEVVLDKPPPKENNMVEIDNPHESLKKNEDGNDGTVEVEKAIELPSVVKVIEEPNSSAEHIEKPINTEDEMLPVEPEVVLAPEETNTVVIDDPHESLKNNEDGNDGTVEVENAPSVADAIEESNCSAEPVEKPINIEDEIQLAEPEVLLDKPPPKKNNMVEFDNPHESLKKNEDGNDGTVEVENTIELPSVVKVIEEPNSSAEHIEKPINTEDEMLPVEPEVVLAPEETNPVVIDDPHESLKNNEDGNDGTMEVENAPSVAEAIEEPNCSAEPVEKPINTEDEIQSAKPEVLLDKPPPKENNMVEINNPHESLKKNEDGNDGTVEVENAIEIPSVVKVIEEPNSSAEHIEKPINTEDEMLPVEPEVLLAPEETNMVVIDDPHESLKNNEDGNDGTVEVENSPSVAEAIEEPNCSAEPVEKPINTEDEIQSAEHEVVLDKPPPKENNMVEIDNPHESLKKNYGNDGTVEFEKAIELPSVVKVIEETNSSAEHIEKPINTEDEMLPIEPEVVLAPEETNTVVIDDPRQSLKNNEDGNDGTVLQVDINTKDNDDNYHSKILEIDTMVGGRVPQENPNEELSDMITEHVKQASVEAPRRQHTDDNEIVAVIEGISEVKQQCSAEISKDDADSKKFNCENEAKISLNVVHEEIERSGLQQNTELTFSRELILDKIEDVILKGESGDKCSHSENINDGIALHEKQLREEMATIADIAEGTSETKRENDDKTLAVEPEVVLNKLVPEEKTVEIDNPHEFLKCNEEGSYETFEGENVIELPSVSNAIVEENNGSQEPIEKPSKTGGDEMLDKLLSEGENRDGQDMGIISNRGIRLNETQQEAEEPSNQVDDEGMTPDELSVQADADAVINSAADLTENLKDSEEACKEKEKLFIPEGKNMDSMVVKSSDDKEHGRIEKEECFADMETENVHGIDDLLGSELVASEITETTLDKAAPKTPEPVDSAPPREVFTTDLQGEINTNDNDNSNQLEQDTIVDGNLSTACKAQENPKEKLSDLITEHEGNFPKESEEPVSTGGLHTDDNETAAVCEVISQMKQHGTVEMSEDDAGSKNSLCQNGAENNLNSAQEDIERSCLQQNTEPTTFSKEEFISEQSNEGILEGETEDKASHSQNTDEGITLQEKQLHEEMATIADKAEGTSETKRDSVEKTLSDENKVMLDKLAPDESKKDEIGNPHEISKSNEEGSDGTVEGEKMIELTSVAKDTIEENNRCTEPIENPSKTEDELPEKLFSEGEKGEGQDTGNILNREIPPNESQPEAEEPSKVLEKDDDEGMTTENPFVHADAVINCSADSTENLIEDGKKSGEVCNENDNTQSILATKTSFPNDDSNETNIQGIEDKEKDKDFIPEGENTENMDSSVVESHDDKEDGKENKEESLAETCKVPLMEIQSQSSDSKNAHIVIGSPLNTSPTEEIGSERGGSSEVEPESIKVSSDTMEDEIVKQEIFSHGSSSRQISSQMEHNIEHDEVEIETIQGVNDLLGSQLVSPEIKETGLGEGTPVSEKTADPAPLIEEVHGTVLEGGVHMNENEDHQCKIIEKDNIVDDSVTEQEENITRAGEDQASEDVSRGLHRDENEIVAVHDVISEVEQQDTLDSKDSLFKYEPEKQNLHVPCEETEKAALPQNADQTAFNEELISVKDEVLKGESEDKAAHSNNNGKTNPQETNMLTVDLDEAKSIQHNENSACANYSTVDENPEEQFDTATDVPTQELKHAYEANKMPEIKVLGDTYGEGQSDLDLISACPADIHVAEDKGENSNAMCLEEVADMENQEDQIKQDDSQRAASEVRGNLSKGIENEISKDCISSNIINKEESCSTPTGDARGNEEDAKESKEVIKEPVTEAIYHNFQTTHADTEEQVASLLEEENPITEIGNETTIAETFSPLRTREGTVTKEILLEEEHSGINSEGRSLNDLEEEKLELNKNSIEHRTEEFMINSSDSSTKVHLKSVQPDEELISSSQSVAEEGDESIISDDALTSSAEDTCPHRVTNTSSKPESIVLEKTQVGSINEEIKKECTTAEDSRMEPQECISGENTFYTQSVESEKISEVGAAETSKDEDNKMFQDKLVPENSNVEPKSVDTSYSTYKEIQGAGMEETNTETSELDSEKSDHVIEYAPEVHKLEMPLEAEQNGLVEENLAETEIEEIVIKKTNEENDITKADISSEETQIADQSVIVKSSMDCPEEVLSLGAYQEDEPPEENELEKLGEDERIKEEASSDDKAGAESSAAQDSKANILHAIETEVAEESHDGNGKEISEMPILQEHMKHSLDDEKQNEELDSIVNVADTAKTLEDEKVYSCTELQEGITGEADRNQRTESSTPIVSECVQLMQKEPVLTAVKPEIQELETEKVSGAPSETEMNQTKTNEMPTNTSKETSHEHGHDEIQSDIIANSQVLAHDRDSDITDVTNIEQDECSAAESCKAVPTEAILNISTEGSASRTDKNQCTKPELQKENAIKSLTQGPGETTMEIAIEQFLKPKISEDDEAENVEQIKRMQEEDETKNMETVNLKDIIQSMQEKETVVLSAPREDGEADENISTDNINASQDKSAETCQFEAEQIKENAKEASTHMRIEALEQLRTTKAEAVFEGSTYKEENIISDSCRKTMETAEMDQTVQVTQKKHEEETSEGKVVLDTHEKTYQALDEPIAIEDFVYISQNKHEEETKLNENANENVQQATSQNISSSEIRDETVASDDSARLNREMHEEVAISKSHQPPIALAVPQLGTRESHQTRDETIESGSKEARNETSIVLDKEEEHEEARSDEEEEEENEGGEHKGEESGPEAPVIVENATAGDADVKAGKKKHHNILSGVGSKVKHSIAKVKKVITGGKSSPTNQNSPKHK